MKKIKCVNTGGYSLTENNEYDLIKAEGNFLFLNNDKGNLVRYNKDFFEDVVEEPEVPARTERDVINSIVASLNRTTYTDLDGTEKTIISDLDWYGSEISCGIKQLRGISDLMRKISQSVNTDEDDRQELKNTLFEKVIRYYILNEIGENAMVLCSNNVEGEEGEDDFYDEDLLNHLNEFSHFKTDVVNNPNSGNDIRMWGFYTAQL